MLAGHLLHTMLRSLAELMTTLAAQAVAWPAAAQVPIII